MSSAWDSSSAARHQRRTRNESRLLHKRAHLVPVAASSLLEQAEVPIRRCYVPGRLTLVTRFNVRLRLVGLLALLALATGGALARGALRHGPGAGPHAGRSDHGSLLRVLSAYGGLTLSYEANQGQFDPRVAFTAHAGPSTLALTASGALLTVARRAEPRLPRPSSLARRNVSYSQLGLTLLGARKGLWPIGSDRQPGKVNYLSGKNRSRWHTGVPTYAQALYERAWPGIDVGFAGRQRQIEYAFKLAPDAEATRIAIRLTGARSLRIARNGDLLARLPDGVVVRELAPHAYQRIYNGRRVRVWSRYALGARGVVRIALGTYDRRRKLVIDPSVALDYSTYLGGSGGDIGEGIAVDRSGAAYITGFTGSSDFPTKHAFQPKHDESKSDDAFVTKLDPSGALAYSTYLGGRDYDGQGRGIAVDSTGAAYVTGETYSMNFPTKHAFQPKNNALAFGGSNAFVTKLHPSGTLAYSTYLGGSVLDAGAGIAVDSKGAAWVTGVTESTDFPTKHAFQPKNNAPAFGAGNAFVTKLDPSGALAYSTYLGGSGADGGAGIAVDRSGAAYVTGGTQSADFPTKHAFQPKHGGVANSGSNAFVTKLDPSGALAYSTYLGGRGFDAGAGIAVDRSGAAYVTGETYSMDFPTKHAFQPKHGGVANSGRNAFVTKLDPPGTLAYSSFLGGSRDDEGNGIAVDSSGAAYVTGAASSTDFPTTDAFEPKLLSGGDVFVTKLDPSGLLYSIRLGGSEHAGDDAAAGIAVDSQGAAYLTGSTFSNGFPTKNAFQPRNTGAANGGNGTAFVLKLAPFGPPQGGGGAKRVSAHLHLGSIRLFPARGGCKAERARSAAISSIDEDDCTRVLLRLAGTIDTRADGHRLIVTLRAKLGHRSVLIVAHPRVRYGRWRLRARLRDRNREPGDRWKFTIVYPGDKQLRAASITGGFLLEVEVANKAPI